MPKKAGRPYKDEDLRKSAHLSIRLSAKLRDLLQSEANSHPEGRTFSQEISIRLWESFPKEKAAFEKMLRDRQ